MVFLPLYLLVMNWVLLFEVSLCWIEYWICEHLMFDWRWDICCENGMFYWFTWCMFWHSIRGFPMWHWDNLCIGVDAVFILCSPIETLEWFFVARWGIVIWSNYVIIVERICTSESMNPRPCFQAFQYRFCSLLSLVNLLFYIFILQKPISTIHITLVSPSLCRTTAPIQYTIVLGVLRTQDTLCYLVAGLFERDHLHPTPPTDW